MPTKKPAQPGALKLFLLASVLMPAAAFMTASDAKAQNTAGQTTQATDAPAPDAGSTGAGIEEIIVTAQKVAQPLSKVPVSVTAISQQALTIQRIETPTDLAKVAPGLVFISNGGSGEQRNNQIFIRGLESGNGVPTVGVYLDDTPLTIRSIATGGTSSFFPNFFDLDRIEVLRGPQGTLFGVGSEAGTVRFITTAPSLETFSGHALADIGFTDGGDPSYETGVAVGGPIVEGKIGFRGSLYYREDGGYIDRKDIYTNAVTQPNDNKTMTYSGRLAVEFAPIDDLTITPSFFAQRTISSGVSRYYPATQFTTPTGQTLDRRQFPAQFGRPAGSIRGRQPGDKIRRLRRVPHPVQHLLHLSPTAGDRRYSLDQPLWPDDAVRSRRPELQRPLARPELGAYDQRGTAFHFE